MAGGPGNPLGARAMYLGNTEYRIHGTNAPSTIGQRVSSGCIRLTNEDVSDLFDRVSVGAKVVVLPMNGHGDRAASVRLRRPCAQRVSATYQRRAAADRRGAQPTARRWLTARRPRGSTDPTA